MNVFIKFLKVLLRNFHPTAIMLAWDFLIAKAIGNKSILGLKQSLQFGFLIGCMLILIVLAVLLLPLIFLGEWELFLYVATTFAIASPLFVGIPFAAMMVYLHFACEEIGTFLVRSKMISENKTGFGEKFLKGEYSISLPSGFNTRKCSEDIFDLIFQESENVILEKLNTNQVITLQTHATVIRKIRTFLNQNNGKFALEVNGVNIMESFNKWSSLSKNSRLLSKEHALFMDLDEFLQEIDNIDWRKVPWGRRDSKKVVNALKSHGINSKLLKEVKVYHVKIYKTFLH